LLTLLDVISRALATQPAFCHATSKVRVCLITRETTGTKFTAGVAFTAQSRSIRMKNDEGSFFWTVLFLRRGVRRSLG
jgi:hypothetical protein